MLEYYVYILSFSLFLLLYLLLLGIQELEQMLKDEALIEPREHKHVMRYLVQLVSHISILCPFVSMCFMSKVEAITMLHFI